MRRSRVGLEGDRAVARHTPGANRVEVVIGPRAADRAELCHRRLDVPGVVYRAAHQQTLITLPFPHVLKAHLRLRHLRREQLGAVPRLSGIGADLDARDLAATAPGEPRDWTISRTVQLLRIRRTGDDRLRVHLVTEDSGFVA